MTERLYRIRRKKDSGYSIVCYYQIMVFNDPGKNLSRMIVDITAPPDMMSVNIAYDNIIGIIVTEKM